MKLNIKSNIDFRYAGVVSAVVLVIGFVISFLLVPLVIKSVVKNVSTAYGCKNYVLMKTFLIDGCSNSGELYATTYG